MKRAVLIALAFMMLAASKGRVAWYGEHEFDSSVKSLEDEGYKIKYIDALDEKTLSTYDVLVICLAEPPDAQKEAIYNFVEEGGGLLIIYNAMLYSSIEEVLSEYELEYTAGVGTDIVFPFLTEERIEELKKRIGISQRGRGRVIAVGYDPLTFQAVTLLIDIDNLFSFGLDWLCQSWHAEQTQKLLTRRLVMLIVPVVILAVIIAAGYYYFKRKKKLPKESEKSEKIRELKAKFVYGELSRDEYQEELERLERSAE